MNWRLASRLAVATSALLVIIVILVVTHGNTNGQQSAPALQGTDLGGDNAPNFQLTDQFGKPVSLAQFHGHPVILTFLYTHCPDFCPLTADKIHLALSKLGSTSAANVGVLAVSTDPQNDDVTSAYQFSETHHLLNQWHFLIGSQAQLSQVWSAYHVYAGPAPTTSPSGPVDHTVAIFLIDKQGHERVYLPQDFDPNVLAKDLQVLLA
jgi:protein SCO1/2